MKNKYSKIVIISVIALLIGIVLMFISPRLYQYGYQENTKYTRVTLRLLWEAQAAYAGYYMAKELGYYEDAGFDVSIVPSLGTGDIIQLISEKPIEFGVTQLSNLIRAIDKGMPVKGLSQIVQDSNLLIVAYKTSGISTIGDFKGKVLSTWWGRNDFMMRMLLENAGLNQTDISILDEKYWSNESFLRREADLVTAMRYNEYNQLIMRNNISESNLIEGDSGFDLTI